MNRTHAVFLALLALSACHSSPRDQAKKDMIDSKDAYKDCIDDHDGDASKCAGEKTSYDTDVSTYNTLK